MLSTNLLPHTEKKMIRVQTATRAVGYFTFLLLVIMAVGFFLLLPSYFYASLARHDAERALLLEEQAYHSQQVSETIRETKKVKDGLNEVRKFLETSSAASTLLAKFFAAGDGITITSFTLDKTGELTIEGIAATRDQLLGFEKALRTSSNFLEVTFPLGDFVHKRDVKFTARMKVQSLYNR